MAGSILGNRVLRKEDPKFLTTGGVYVADLRDEPLLAGAAHVTYVRSTAAHARILSIDASAALEQPGVIGVFTGADLGLEPLPAPFNPAVARPLLAMDVVRYVGEPIAAVVTERADQGEDAAEAVIVDYDFLEVLVDVDSALASSTHLYPAAGGNVVFDSSFLGMPGLTGDEFFAGCDVVVSERIVNQRVAPCPLEVRGAAAAWDGGRLVQWLSTQHAQGAIDPIKAANGLEDGQLRVITPDVGGGFGAKIGVYPEEIVLGRLAKELGRPVRWQETRSESMVALGHGRAQVQQITIGGDRDGKVLAYRLHVLQDSGAYADMGTILAPFMTRPMSSGVYAIPQIECQTTSIVTNTTPIVAYRGAGRPEATAAIERAMDLFAAEIGKDAAEVRRINLIPKFLEPHTTVIGQTYDVGDYETALDNALAAAGYAELRADQAARRERGDVKQLGIGVSVYVEITGGVPPLSEAAKVEVLEDGRAVVYTGTSPHGQGHATSWAMLASEQTGIPMDRIDLVWGDTDRVPVGGGTMGSRSLQQGGAAVHEASILLVDKAKELAAKLLEADVADVVLDKDNGAFHVTGTPAVAKSWADLAVAAKDEGGLAVEHTFNAAGATFPFGSHVAVVEVDTETGKVRHLRHVACDDAGRVLNPLILEGQIHGGVAQGAAQALLEEVRYDDDGNPITSNLADYAFISAAELASIEIVHMETPTPLNPLGAKGIGESGTIGSTPAVQSAVIDAVRHLGVRHIDMPATPERVWAAIAAARS
ncbi:MAG: xanthine dehydrogenase family protein molybdopterin-binding subunit [Acidimicrobiia bacterium]